MKRRFFLLAGLVFCIASISVQAQATTLVGTVTDEHHSPIPGVFVTAKDVAKKMATTVLTDTKGRYQIRGLSPDRYRLEVSRIGYQPADVKDFTLLERDARKDFQLSPAQDIAAQMPAYAWLASMPEGDFKANFLVGCTICHSFAGGPDTRKPRSVDEWIKIIKWMRGNKIDVYSVVPNIDEHVLAQWLATNGFGPDRKTPHFRAPAPPSGDAARVVITEYDVGYPDTWAHDMAIEPSTGIAWVGDYTHDELIRVDPRDGAHKVYKLPLKGSGVHTLHFDREGALWMTFQLVDMVCRFDPKTEQFRTYPGLKKGSLVHSFAYDPFGYIQYDQQGRLWVSEFGGNAMASIDPKSGQVREYSLPGNKATAYGIAMDKQGRIWYTKYLENVLGMLDPETSVATERQMPHKNSGPHRMAIDAKQRLWIPESGTGKLAMFDIAKGTFTEYALPEPDTFPYSVRVDGATGAVWITGNGADSLYRFDPERKTFTTYRIPGQISYARMVAVDYSTGDVWTSLSNLPNKHTSEPMHGELVRFQLSRP
ncbi:MAG: carboxypeptidase regulatory-like domain-containing protein [Candidatus Binataceae bacterium]|jgi:streptogramin lyase